MRRCCLKAAITSKPIEHVVTKLDPIPPNQPTVLAEIAALTQRVGERVRAARAQAGLSRRELSERSGVSQRYLAQIEAGDGNISLALLVKLGHALGMPIEAFLSDPTTGLERNATSKANRIALIGLRGAGKSTLGKRISQSLGMPFVELNSVIEQESGLSTPDVIAMYGPEGYRAFEHRALQHALATHPKMVLAVAGGIVSAGDTFETLLKHFTTIWLQASPIEHMTRVRNQGDEITGNVLDNSR